jgi:hypothetical protein
MRGTTGIDFSVQEQRRLGSNRSRSDATRAPQKGRLHEREVFRIGSQCGF